MSELPTPPHCLADICIVPIGTGSASVSKEIADVTRLFRAAEAGTKGDKEAISCIMHSAGTTIEGPWDAVMKLIGQAHALLHQNGVVRVQSDVRIGTRTDKLQTPQDKIDAVEARLAADKK